MAIKLKCPNCRERLFADESDRGGTIRCAGCDTRVPVPAGDGGTVPPAPPAAPVAKAVPAPPVATPTASRDVVTAQVVQPAKPRPAAAIPTIAPVAPARTSRSRDEDEDDLDDRPRRRRREDDEGEQAESKGNGLLFVILGVGVLLLAGIGVGVYYLIQDDTPPVAINPDGDGNKPNPINPNPINPNPVIPKGNLPQGWDTLTGDGFTVGLPQGVNEGQWGVNGLTGKIWTGREAQRERVAAYLTLPPGRKVDDLPKLVAEALNGNTARPLPGVFENGRWLHQFEVPTVLNTLKRAWVHVCQDRVYFFWFESADPPPLADARKRGQLGESIKVTHLQGAVDAVHTGHSVGPGPDPTPKPPETPFEPVPTAAEDGFTVRMPGGSKLKGERHQYGIDRKYQVVGKKFEAKDGPYTFQVYYHDLADEADYDADKCFKSLFYHPQPPAGTDETVGGLPATRWTLKSPFGGTSPGLTVRAGFRVFSLVVTKDGIHRQADPELDARGKKFLDSFTVTFDPKKAPTEATDPAWTVMARTEGFTATAPRGTEIRDYQRGFRDTEVKGKQYISEDDTVRCVVTTVLFGPKVDPDSVLLDIHGREKIVSGPKDVAQNGITWKELALGGFNNEVRARVRTFVSGNAAVVLKVETKGQVEREVALKARTFLNSVKLSGGAGGGTVIVGNGEFASAGKVQPFWTAVVLPGKKELLTLGARNPADLNPGGILRRYSYPDFKLKATYHLPLPVNRAVADEKSGKLVCSVISKYAPTLDPREAVSWTADLQLFDLNKITDGNLAEGEEVKPLKRLTVGQPISGLEVDPLGGFAYAAAVVLPVPVKGQPPRAPSGRLFKIDLSKDDFAGTPINHREPVDGLRLATAGKTLVTGETTVAAAPAGKPFNLVVVNAISWKIEKLIPLPAPAKDLTFTGGDVLALVPVEGRNRVYALAAAANEAVDVTPKDLALDGFGYLRVTPDDKRLIGSAGVKQNGVLLAKVTGSGEKAKFEKVTSGTTVAGAATGGHLLLTPDSKYAVFNSGAVVDLTKTAAPKD